MKKLFIIFLFFVASSFGQYADFASPGYSAGAAEYLKRPVSAQSAALAGAVVAWREDLAGVQYNPAILDATPAGSYLFHGTYSLMSLDRRHLGADAAGTIGNYLAAGISFTNYGVGNIEGRDSLGFQTDTFDYSENSFALSAAGRIVGNVAIGGTFRYLYEKLSTGRANGIGFDLGATYEPLPLLCVGLSVQNLLSKLWWNTGHDDPVLTDVRLGVAGLFLDKSLITEIDVLKTVQQPIQISLGVQYTLFRIVSARGGISTDVDYLKYHTRYPDYSLGLGIRYSIFGFDYAIIIPDSDLGISHKISLAIALKDPFK
jgi:hypothetical protein